MSAGRFVCAAVEDHERLGKLSRAERGVPSAARESRTQPGAQASRDLVEAQRGIADWLASIDSPHERLAAAARYLTREVPRGGSYDVSPRRFWWVEPPLLRFSFATDMAVEEAIRFFDAGFGVSREEPLPLDQERVARWFRDRALAVGARPGFSYRPARERRRLWNPGTTIVYGAPVPAWSLDGTYVLQDPQPGSSTLCVGRLSILALMEMGRLARVSAPPNGLVERWRDADARRSRST